MSTLELTGPSVHDARLGSNAQVPCWFTVNKPPVDLNDLTIFWHFLDKEILSYDTNVRTNSSRNSLNTEVLATGIANLTISSIQIPDGGRYKCSVIYGSEGKKKEVWLDIGAPPQVTITDKTVVLNVESVLRCSATGFFPPDIGVKWFRDGEKLVDNIFLGDPWRNQDRTYSVNSTVTITPTEEDRGRNFSCRVQHKYLWVPLKEDFHLLYEGRRSVRIVVACSVLVVVILIIIIAFDLWWKLKSRRKDIGPLTLGVIAGPPKLIDGEKVVLYCTVDNALEDLCVTWLMRRDGQDKEIQTSQIREDSEEEESLLDRSYVIKSQLMGRQYLSSLSFIPHMERHKDLTFICRVVSGQQNNEKTFCCKRIYGKPQMSSPIEITMADSSRVQFSLNLQKFYPKDINISWSWENKCGKYGLSPTAETISTRDDHLTYEATSVIQIPDYTFRVHPEMKITVEWEHESMETSQTRSLSVRDLLWHPRVGPIRFPKLEDKIKATMTCNISGYFPNLLSVNWFTKQDGNETALSMKSSNMDKTYTISNKEKKQTDNTYSCQASVTFTPLISSDQGSEIICRVEHPSEERPIERSTGPLHISECPWTLRGPFTR
ncbi:uncharacterized protein [Phyllobates terribilis]|uniref:uncharacterized protein isoform X2 n=1 Tax=Phyllobates terribilis TaxID=111132 RepID=UPI003CCB13B1